MPMIVDASVTAAWGLADEDHPTARRAEDRLLADATFVPGLWWFEVRNALLISERRGRIVEPDVALFLSYLGRLPIEVDLAPNDSELMRLARRHRLTVYDATYLELALRQGADLATLDNRLASAAKNMGVGLV